MLDENINIMGGSKSLLAAFITPTLCLACISSCHQYIFFLSFARHQLECCDCQTLTSALPHPLLYHWITDLLSVKVVMFMFIKKFIFWTGKIRNKGKKWQTRCVGEPSTAHTTRIRRHTFSFVPVYFISIALPLNQPTDFRIIFLTSLPTIDCSQPLHSVTAERSNWGP